MPLSLLTIDNTPLSRLALASGQSASAMALRSGWNPAKEPSSLAAMPRSLGPSEGLLINSSVPDFNRLPPCPYNPEQVAILVSALTPLSRSQLTELGYRHFLDKDHGFAALCHAISHWRGGLGHQSREWSGGAAIAPPAFSPPPSPAAIAPELVARLKDELTALIDAKLLRTEGDIHAHLEQVVSRWLSKALEPKISAQVTTQLPELVASALATELDRLTGAKPA